MTTIFAINMDLTSEGVDAVRPHSEHRPKAATQASSLRVCGVREPQVNALVSVRRWFTTLSTLRKVVVFIPAYTCT